MGGAGSAVTETLTSAWARDSVLQLGLPDRFIDHGEQGALLAGVGLGCRGIENSIRSALLELICVLSVNTRK
jgi:1-deoxy-D-xylulose-5-phosphate synthase